MMKIALIGGTGNIGKGLALRWAKNHDILIGSRSGAKAEEAALRYKEILSGQVNIKGCSNTEAVKEGEVVVLSIPYRHIKSTIEPIRDFFTCQIVISPASPMEKRNGYFIYTPPAEGSLALEVKRVLPGTVRLFSAFQNIAAETLADTNRVMEGDVIVCGDDPEAKRVVMGLAAEIKNLRPLDGGPLEVSSMVEALTPLMLTVGLKNKIHSPQMKIV